MKTSGQYVSCSYKKAWVMFDLDNGHSCGKNDLGNGYLWVLKSKKEAEELRKYHKQNNLTRLSKPIKISYE